MVSEQDLNPSFIISSASFFKLRYLLEFFPWNSSFKLREFSSSIFHESIFHSTSSIQFELNDICKMFSDLEIHFPPKKFRVLLLRLFIREPRITISVESICWFINFILLDLFAQFFQDSGFFFSGTDRRFRISTSIWKFCFGGDLICSCCCCSRYYLLFELCNPSLIRSIEDFILVFDSRFSGYLICGIRELTWIVECFMGTQIFWVSLAKPSFFL